MAYELPASTRCVCASSVRGHLGRSHNKLNKTMKWILPMGKTWRLRGVNKKGRLHLNAR